MRANPGEITRVLVEVPIPAEVGFDPDVPFLSADGARTVQGYVWHCHILEHEENDMMLPLRYMS